MEGEEKIPLATRIAALVHAHFDALPARYKPRTRDDGSREWIPMSGFVVVQGQDTPSETLTCVAIATGARCLSASQIPECRGMVLHDCHAEVLAVRALNYWLINECSALIQQEQKDAAGSTQMNKKTLFVRRRAYTRENDMSAPFEIHPDVKIYMYSTCAPCGDCSMELCMAEQEDATPWAVPPAVDVKHDTPVLLDGRAHFSILGVVRRKPCRADAEPTLSKSCTDKLALRQVTSLLSYPASLLIAPTSSAYITSLVLPEEEISRVGCQRAFGGGPTGRMRALVNQTFPASNADVEYRFRPFDVLPVPMDVIKSKWPFGKYRSDIARKASKPSNISAVWIASASSLKPYQVSDTSRIEYKPRISPEATSVVECIIGGAKQGNDDHKAPSASDYEDEDPHTARYRQYTARTQKLDVDALGKPGQILVVPLRKRRRRTIEQQDNQNSGDTSKKVTSPVSADFFGNFKSKENGDNDYVAYLDELRASYPPGDTISREEYIELQAQVEEGFTLSQLSKYYYSFPKQSTPSPSKEDIEINPINEDVDNDDEQWQAIVSHEESQDNKLSNEGISKSQKTKKTNKLRKDILTERIIRDCWQLEVHDEMGSLKVNIPSQAISVILSSEQYSLEELAHSHNTKIEPFGSLNFIRVSGNRSACESVREIVKAYGAEIRTETLEQPLLNDKSWLIDGKAAKSKFLESIAQTHGIYINDPGRSSVASAAYTAKDEDFVRLKRDLQLANSAQSANEQVSFCADVPSSASGFMKQISKKRRMTPCDPNDSKLPVLEVEISVPWINDPEAKFPFAGPELLSVKAIVEENSIDYLLPEVNYDIRFTRTLTQEIYGVNGTKQPEGLRNALLSSLNEVLNDPKEPFPPSCQVPAPATMLHDISPDQAQNSSESLDTIEGNYWFPGVQKALGTMVRTYEYSGERLCYSPNVKGSLDSKSDQLNLEMFVNTKPSYYTRLQRRRNVDETLDPASDSLELEFRAFYMTACQLAIELTQHSSRRSRVDEGKFY
ncbi:hypothetical protein TCE0_034r10492 [Talaromyces pinophilus]|uniref:A to I editase domain-containing protein n=1 Tax=Talaromyces pinophilus TaxID=128442 RepID=A0A6V8HDQ8_TALPI|nr:hypothetical protein TCE0_034r10492 [Talaromyces pinophilus]